MASTAVIKTAAASTLPGGSLSAFTMMIVTDKVTVPDGTDFTLVCKKIPFAFSCLSELPHPDTNLVDLDLINKMGIPLCNIRVTRMTLLGHDFRAVGRIKQTIQCVSKGRVQGTIHLEAKVVRDLYNILGVDCAASARTFSRIMGNKPPDPPYDDQDDEELHQPITNLEDEPDENTKNKSPAPVSIPDVKLNENQKNTNNDPQFPRAQSQDDYRLEYSDTMTWDEHQAWMKQQPHTIGPGPVLTPSDFDDSEESDAEEDYVQAPAQDHDYDNI